MTQSTRQRSKIKDQVGIEREIKKLWYILFHFYIAIDFVLLVVTSPSPKSSINFLISFVNS